ncbi:MAG: MATE family efflux transporter [Roseburia sp.]
MCHGPLVGKMLGFSVPLIFSGILQLLFQAVDTVVVGRFAGPNSLAAVGSTTSLINLLINLFVGLSVGANVLIAQYYGAKKEQEVRETLHTAITLSLVCGVLLAFVGWFAAGQLLRWMDTPTEVLSLATLYMKIYFLGMPVSMLYNFGSAILRAMGDTKRPLYFLMVSGVINAMLNLVFVICFRMDVAGVATATVISQCISAGLVILCLMRQEGCFQLKLRHLCIQREKVVRIVCTGLPAGLQGVIFALSNVLIQSSVNSFGPVAMAGNSAAASIEGFIYMSMNAYHHTALNFVSQNYGAGEYGRIKKVMRNSLIMVSIVGLVMGVAAYGFAPKLLSIYSSDPEVISYGILRMSVISTTYFLCGIMDVMVGTLRGMGYAIMPMVVSLIGACGLRIVWIYTIFRQVHTLTNLYASYPVTWAITFCAHMICFVVVMRKVQRK